LGIENTGIVWARGRKDEEGDLIGMRVGPGEKRGRSAVKKIAG